MSEPENLTVVVTLTQNDYAVALRALAQARSSWISRVLFWISLAFLCYMFFAWLRISDRSLVAGVAGLAGFVLVGLLFKYGVPYFSARSFVKKNPDKLGPAKHSISQDGTSYESKHGSGHTAWSAYQRIRETRDLFLLYTQSNFAQILPKRCFDTPRDVETYRQILRNCYKGRLELLS